jgi:hypothetical protein
MRHIPGASAASEKGPRAWPARGRSDAQDEPGDVQVLGEGAVHAVWKVEDEDAEASLGPVL